MIPKRPDYQRRAGRIVSMGVYLRIPGPRRRRWYRICSHRAVRLFGSRPRAISHRRPARSAANPKRPRPPVDHLKLADARKRKAASPLRLRPARGRVLLRRLPREPARSCQSSEYFWFKTPGQTGEKEPHSQRMRP